MKNGDRDGNGGWMLGKEVGNGDVRWRWRCRQWMTEEIGGVIKFDLFCSNYAITLDNTACCQNFKMRVEDFKVVFQLVWALVETYEVSSSNSKLQI